MNRELGNKAKSPVKQTSGKQQEPKFDKPIGSSHKDEADLRDVVKEASRKSK
jgi:hypothetical protein